MTVKELIAILQECDENAEVYITMWDGSGTFNAKAIYSDNRMVDIDMTAPRD